MLGMWHEVQWPARGVISGSRCGWERWQVVRETGTATVGWVVVSAAGMHLLNGMAAWLLCSGGLAARARVREMDAI